jgi:hypothetical protein
MTNKSKPISDTARALLTTAATRCDNLVQPPKLPIAAARQVVRSLFIGGLVEEVPAPIEDANFAWRIGEDGSVLMLRATALALGQIAGGAASGARASTKEPAVGAAVDAAEAGGIGGEGMMPAVVSTAEVSLVNSVRRVKADPAQAPDATQINFERTGRPKTSAGPHRPCLMPGVTATRVSRT